MGVSPPEVRLARYPEATALLERGEADERIETALALVGAGVRGVDIADELGLARSSAFALLNDPRGERARKRKRNHYGHCRDCGRRVYNSGSVAHQERCTQCRNAFTSDRGRATIIDAIRDWHRRYGEVPGAQDWNVAHAEATAHPERLALIVSRHADRKWPYSNSAIHHFGTWNAAIEAAGFDAVPSGQRRDPETHRLHLQGKRGVMPATLRAETVIEREIARFEERKERAEAEAANAAEQVERLKAALAALSNGKPS